MHSAPVIYEVNLVPDPAIEDQFDDWLQEHVRDMLALPGFIDATISRVEQEDGRAARTVHYELQDRATLERYLTDDAPRMRQAGVDRFGKRFTATRRILVAGQRLALSGELDVCTNCDTMLTGQYCAQCGQRFGTRMISLWELIREASEFLTDLDSRLWRTLGMLLFRPGKLTLDYLRGRRARYIPPLKLFIVFSLLFFFLLALGARIGMEGPRVSTEASDGDNGVSISFGSDDDAAGEVSGDADLAPDTESGSNQIANPVATAADQSVTADTESGSEVSVEADENRCEDLDIDLDLGPESGWLRTWLTEERLTATCNKVVEDHGESFTRALLENIPMMMFFFLPVMALVMKLAYPLSKRYYVEHLLFLVHFHAFFYFVLTLNLIVEWAFEGSTRLPDWPAPVIATLTMIYIPVYLYRAMRVVYQQSAGVTLAKYALLGVAYFIGLFLMFAVTLIVTAFTL